MEQLGVERQCMSYEVAEERGHMPIYKKGDRCENFQAITILNAAYKVPIKCVVFHVK